ncbi:cytochrome P450 [Nocardia sp. NBC_01503]|uniref:cytochrome P450 family protein n=1 Tax=Nocardia sp. NBC_01503 TaxID=2975997 RepID=UPI002E7BE585|nr:cytochrome P450 [Nocardia sp. NBC_01503]WTL32203.1 cytochrome P450 [Nocardia sp. NBC_01503]
MSELLDDNFFADPHEYYRRWRAHGPVRRVDFGDGLDRWLILGYEQGRAALADPRLRKDIAYFNAVLARKRGVARVNPRPQEVLRHMLNSDPPDHTRLRKAVARAFTARQVARLQPIIERTTAELLDAMDESDRVDLLESFAVPLPVTVICHLLGVAIEDHDTFRAWTRAMVGTADSATDRARAHDDMVRFLRDTVRDKQADPGDDLLSLLVTDTDADLDEQELVGMALLLLVAGHETTVNLIGNGMLALLRDRPWLDRLRADPELIPDAVEEFLRFDGPVNLATPRFTVEPITIGDTVIPAGEVVYVALSAGNHDPAHYPDPDHLDLTADRDSHLAFGHGVHFCVGAPLARLEARTAFAGLLHRFPDIELAVAESDLHRYPNPIIRGLTDLPVRLGRTESIRNPVGSEDR